MNPKKRTKILNNLKTVTYKDFNPKLALVQLTERDPKLLHDYLTKNNSKPNYTTERLLKICQNEGLIHAVKHHRNLYESGLKEAKEIVEHIQQYPNTQLDENGNITDNAPKYNEEETLKNLAYIICEKSDVEIKKIIVEIIFAQ